MATHISYNMGMGILTALGLGLIAYLCAGLYDYVIGTNIPNFAYAVAAAMFTLTIGRAYIKDVKEGENK